MTDVAGARYWLAGGAQDVGVILHYVPVNKFSRESPDKIFCDDHLKTTVAAATILNIAVHSSFNNLPVQNICDNHKG